MKAKPTVGFIAIKN